MKYILIEFLGVFMLVFYRTLSNIVIEKDNLYNINNSLITGFLLMAFSLMARGNSQGLFNPTFAVTQNMWCKLETGKTLGYMGAHIIASMCAVCVIVWSIPYEGFFDLQ